MKKAKIKKFLEKIQDRTDSFSDSGVPVDSDSALFLFFVFCFRAVPVFVFACDKVEYAIYLLFDADYYYF